VDDAHDVTPTRATAQLGPALAVWLVLLPFFVLAVVLVVTRNDFLPIGDYALTELQVRNIGRHEVLTGLYSRGVWSHPGPLYFYLIAPFYWLTGGASIGMGLATVAINAASIGGIAFIAWRRGGTAMLLCALLGGALVMRTMGPEFLFDPWNNYVVTLPYGLLLFATWATICGERWALVLATIVASFLAQTHVGFVLLVLPLVALGAAWMVLPILRCGADPNERRSTLRWLALAVAVAVTLWLPPLYDLLTNPSSNVRKVWRYFTTSEEGTHSVTSGWRIVTGQFTWPPEWLTAKRTDLVGYGESPFKTDSAIPWLLILVVLAAAYLWYHRRDDRAGARYMVIVLVAAIALGIVGITRTLGPALDYRLRYLWMLGLLAFVLTAWAGWQLVARLWPRAERRVLVPIAAVAIVVVTVVNLFTAATVSSLWRADSEVMAHITPPVLDAIGPGDGQVILTDDDDAAWYTRGLVVQLEQEGIDARVPPKRGPLFGPSRVRDPDAPVKAALFLAMGPQVEQMIADPRYRLITRWQPDPDSAFARSLRGRARLDRELRAGRITTDEYIAQLADVMEGPPHDPLAEDLAVFLDTKPRSTMPSDG